jgi:hypothetical protein
MFSSILIIVFVSLIFMDIIQGNIFTGQICIAQLLKRTFTIAIGLLDPLSVTRILAQPFVIALGIPNELMNPYFNMHFLTKNNKVKSSSLRYSTK